MIGLGVRKIHPANKIFLRIALPVALVLGAKQWEGVEYTAYKDIVGVSTVCYGHTGSDIELNKTYTQEECDSLLNRDLFRHAKGMLECINVPINPNHFVAYSLFTYNIGIGAFCNSTALRLINEGRYEEACEQLHRWNRAGGRVVRGLTNRRNFEYQICITPYTN